MIRHIIAAIATILALWAMAYVYNLDQEADRFGEIQKIIEATKMEVKTEKPSAAVQRIEEPESIQQAPNGEAEKKDDEIQKQLKALKERAGNIMAFKVSPLYKQKCSSCHGVNGEGIIGPKLVGKTADEVLQALQDFKSGKRKNYVMYGLLSKMNEDQLQKLAQEIGTFAEKLKASQQ